MRWKEPYIGIKTYEGKLDLDVLFNTSGDYGVLVRVKNKVEVDSASSEPYYEYLNTLDQIIKDLPSGFIIHKQDVFYKKTFKSDYKGSSFLRKSFFKNMEGRVFLEQETILTISKEVKKARFFSHSDREFNEFLEEVAKMYFKLNESGLKPEVLKKEQIENHLIKSMMCDFNTEFPYLNNIKPNDEFLEVGNREVQVVNLVDISRVDLPSEIMPVSQKQRNFWGDILSFFFDLEADTLIYNQIIYVENQREIRGELERKKRRHESVIDPANDLAAEEIQEVFMNIEKSNTLLVRTHYSIIFSAHKDVRKDISNQIEGQLFRIGVRPSKEAYNQFELLEANLPVNQSRMQDYDKFLTTLDVALCFCFLEQRVKSEESDFLVYYQDRKGVPVGVDLFETPMGTRINNRNMFVLGPSGSGKSFFMNHTLSQYVEQDTDIVIVDVGHSYSAICDYYGGAYITHTKEKPITANPFKFTEEEYNIEKLESLKNIVLVLWKGGEGSATKTETDVILRAIELYYDDWFAYKGKGKVKELNFNSFYEFSIETIEQIKEEKRIEFEINNYKFILEKFYKGGRLEDILNQDTDDTLFDERFIVFEIDNIKDDPVLFPVITLLIMDVFIQKMRLKSNRKGLIIEEAWKAIMSPLMAANILYLYKTVRKFRGFACLVTQDIEDILKSETIQNAIISNSDTTVLLDQRKFRDNYEDIASLLALNETQQSLIFTVNDFNNFNNRGYFKEAYIKRGATGEVYGIEVSDEEYLAYTTERLEKEWVGHYVKKNNGNIEEGILNLIEERKKSKLNLGEFVIKKQNEYEQVY